MQLTAQDKKAAREGFAFVVIRGGKRVCYASTLGEAKRECGKSGKVVAISGMSYAAKNPRKRNPSAAFQHYKQAAKADAAGDHDAALKHIRLASREAAREGSDMLEYKVALLRKKIEEGRGGRNLAGFLSAVGRKRNPAHKLNAEDRKAISGGFRWLVMAGSRRVAYTKDKWYAEQLADRPESGLRHQVIALTGSARNPSAEAVGHSVGKHAKYAARGAKVVGKKAWAGTKSFFGSAYKSFKKHNPR